MTEGRLVDYLDNMLQAARLACTYIDGMTKEDFLADRRSQQAVTMNLVIIGECAARVLANHTDFIDKFPDVPWKSMKGMRNRIAHGYFEINLDVVWETVRA